jgi:hypothetical protein
MAHRSRRSVGVGFEFAASYLKAFESVEFAATLLGWLAKLVLVCDFTVFAAFAVITTARTLHSILKTVGIDIPALVRWIWRWIKTLFGRR